MQKENTEPSARERYARGPRQAKGCCLLIVSIFVACFILLLAGIACIIIVDTINLRGEDHTFSWRVERYKVACQFIWVDFREWLSRKLSTLSPAEREVVPCPAEREVVPSPAESPESWPGPDSGPEP